MAMQMKTSKLDEIAKSLRESGILPSFDPDESWLLIRLWHALARGRALPDKQITAITANLGIAPDIAISLLHKIGERNDEGHVIGIAGLSMDVSSYRFQVNGQTLYTWCAWDTLFLPAMLGQTATVESSCEATEEKIRLTVSPESVEHADPASAVISMLAPSQPRRDSDSAEDIQGAFCHYVHFFRSAETAAEWVSGKPHNLQILSVEEGHTLGKMVFQELLAYV